MTTTTTTAGDTATGTLTSLQTDRADLGRTRIVRQPLPALAPGEALLRIDRLAVTTNNITYAAFGDTPQLRYWSFFPTGEAGWGHMPAWGFAEVVASTVDGVEPGERFYGYWPVASHLVMAPVRVTERGFYDGAPHRQDLVSAYNQYQRTRSDEAYQPADENYQALLRPLFITSFMLADFLQDNGFFGAQQLLFSSASSKTAYGTAFCLQDVEGIDSIALTSAGNQAFVDGLGCYRGSVAYGQLESLDARRRTVYVDFSGDAALRARVHHHFGDALAYDCYAGSAQSQDFALAGGPALPGPVPQMYFAPVQIKKRNADWGPAVVTQKFNAAQRAFIRRVADAGRPWMRVAEHRGFDAAQQLVTALTAGRMDAAEGHVVVLG